MSSTIQWVAHRGAAADWPENTLLALDAAVAAGVRWVEVDVQLCADGVPVLLHDADLQRVAHRPESVFALDSASLAGIPVGEPARFGTRFAAARAPTLAELAHWLVRHEEVQAFIEFKPESIARFGRHAVLEASRQALTPAAGRWVPISFDYEVLALAGDAGLERVGWVVRGYDAAVERRARALPARWLFCNHQRLPPGPLPQGPWDWVLYEVGDLATAQALLERGARWLESRAVVELRNALPAAAGNPV